MGFDQRGKRGVRTGRTVRSAFSSCQRGSKREGKPFRGKHREGILEVKSIGRDENVEAVLSAKEELLSGVVYSLGKRRRWNVAAEIRMAQLQGASDEAVVVVERIHRPNSKPSQSANCLSVSNGHGKIVRSGKKLGARAEDLVKCVEAGDSDVACDVFYPAPKSSWSDFGSSLCSSRRTKSASYSRRKKVWQDYDWDFDYEEDDCEVDEQDSEHVQLSEHERAVLDFDIGAYIENMIRKPDVRKVHGGTTTTDAMHEGDKVSRKQHSTVRESSDHNKIIIADDESVQKWIQSRGKRRSNKTAKTPAKVVPSTKATPWQSSQTAVSVNVDKRELEPSFLRHQFQESYREASSIPRRFEIKITQVPLGYEEGFSFSLIVQNESLITSKTRFEKVNVNIVTVAHTGLDIGTDVQSVFVDSLQECFQDHYSSTVKDLVGLSTDAVCKVLSSIGSPKPQFACNKLREPKYSTRMLGAMCGWKASTFVTSEARKDVKREITAKESAMTSFRKDGDDFSSCMKSSPVSCGICFADLCNIGVTNMCFPQCTALEECCHWFCNECWQMHIHMQSIDGKTKITCPEYNCNTVVDSITVMSLIPSWYGKHTGRVVGRVLETSPIWRWCPSDRCSLAVKASPHPSSFDENNRPGSMPVVCGCGSVWCFNCHGKAHWPASCQQAKHFRKKYRSFFKLQEPTKNLITSVLVKRCPKCAYPIEKYQGCNCMLCIMCGSSFCWGCLHLYKDCKCRGYRNLVGFPDIKGTTKVNLPLQPDLLPEQAPFVYIVSKNLNATRRKVLTKNFKRLEWLERSLHKISTTKSVGAQGKISVCNSKAAGFVDFLATNEVPKHLKAVYNVKFQAQLLLEGTAIFVACYRKKAKPGNLVFNLLRLQFIVDRLEDLLSDYSKLIKKGHLQKLTSFAAEGERTTLLIGKQITKLN